MRPGIVLLIALTLAGAAAALGRPWAEPRPPARPLPSRRIASVPVLPSPALLAIDPARLKTRLDSGQDVLLVFIGTETFFHARRIPAARCVPYGELRAAFEGIDRDREIILYCGCCGGASEGVSGLALRQLLALGFRNACHLAGHYAAWQAAGYASEGTDPASPEERAHANDAQKKELESFTREADRRRGELEAALRAEPDPARKEGLALHLRDIDRRIEFDGLLLKRRLAEESGDAAKVADIDRILKERER